MTRRLPTGSYRLQLHVMIRVGLLLVLLLGFFGCRTEPESPAEPALAVIGTAHEFNTVNELIDNGTALNSVIVRQLFLKLVEESPDFSSGPPSFEPRLAQRWEFSDDGRDLTFHLRPDVTWSDGVPVTSEDVKFTWEAQTHPDIGWAYAQFKQGIERVTTDGDTRVTFHFNEPTATQIQDANDGVILPKHKWSQLPFAQWRDQPNWFEQNLVSNGPFLLGGWLRGEQLELVRNQNYCNAPLPNLERVVFRLIPDEANLIGQMASGDIDMVRFVPNDQIARLEQAPGVKILEYPTRNYTFLVWNHDRDLFKDPTVRRALAHAVDRRSIVDSLWGGRAKLGSSPILTSVWPHRSDLEAPAFDPERAKELLSEAGFADADGDGVLERQGQAFRFELAVGVGSSTSWQAAEMIQAQLRNVGVSMQPVRLDGRTLFAQASEGTLDANLLTLSIDTNHDLSYTFGTGGDFNLGRYSNAELDALIAKINQAKDKRDVKADLERVQELFVEDQPVLFLWEPSGVLAVSQSLENVEPNAISEFYALERWKRSSDTASSADRD